MGIPRGGLCLTQIASADPNGAPVLDREGTATGADPTMSKGDALPASAAEVSADGTLRGNTDGGPNTERLCMGTR